MYRIIGADGNQYGPISADQLRQWIAEGRANAQTKVLAEGTTEWKTLSEFPQLVGAGPRPAGRAPPGFGPFPPNHAAARSLSSRRCNGHGEWTRHRSHRYRSA